MRLLERIRAFFGAAALDRDFDQEMASHIEMLAAGYRRRGLSEADALRAARVEFGGAAQLREAHRQIRGLPGLDSLLQDLRYAARSLRKSPAFTVLAVMALAIGIGVNTSVFTLYNAAFLRPLQAQNPQRLMQLARIGREAAFSYPEYVFYRDHNRSFSGLTAASAHVVSMSGAPAPSSAVSTGLARTFGVPVPQTLSTAEPASAAVVSGNYFQVLGVSAVAGRPFLPEDDVPAAPPVVMLSENFWENRFARDPSLIGGRLALSGVDAVVIGIAPRDFTGTSITVPDLWAPMTLYARWSSTGDVLRDAGNKCCRLYGRLRGGISPAQAGQDLTALDQALSRDSSTAEGQARRAAIIDGPANRFGQPSDRSDLEGPLPLLAAAGLVLLIACANVAGLLLARSAARQREFAVRLALGAGRARIVRQLLTENAVLSLGAGALATILSSLLLRYLMLQISRIPFADAGAIALDLAPDWRTLCYLIFLSLLATLLFGLTPALEALRPSLGSGLRDEGAAFAGRLRKSRLRGILVGTQVAVCLALLLAAGLLARGSARALALHLGFDYRGVASLEVVLPPSASPAAIAATRVALAHELERLPEVQSVAVASRLPLVHGGMHSFAITAGGGSIDAPGAPEAWYTFVTPSYFDTLRIPIVRGRNFTEREARTGSDYDGAPIIVSQSTAQNLWPNEDPIGKRLAFGPRSDSAPLSDGSMDAHSAASYVIGVAGDIRAWHLDRIDSSGVYLPVTPAYGGSASGNNGRPMGVIALRFSGDEARGISAVRRLLRTGYPDLQATVGDAGTAFATQSAFLSTRLGALAAALVGILGLLITAVGIYGTVSFAVTQRVKEIGVRIALGGTRGDVVRGILFDTMRPVAIGMLFGFAAGAVLSRALHKLLFGLGALDPVTFVGVSAFLAAIALMAGFVPARRATRVDPAIALRYE